MEWDKQWGRLGTEGNLWWLGSKRANWEMVMGKAKLGWVRESRRLPLRQVDLFPLLSSELTSCVRSAFAVPIPARPHGDDGLSYVPNPRFSDKGEWRMRREWPKELQ
mgnify:CR=1 FL=1